MKKKIIKWILVLLWMGLIFYFSSRNSEESTNQSQGIIDKTNLVDIYEEKNNVDRETAILEVDRIVRKIAHASIYFILAILVCSALSEYNLSISKIIMVAFIICLLYSCSDEIHQLYVSGRSGEVRDVIIDNIGCTIGYIVYGLFRRRKL